jgi:hypothetical protein
LALSPNSFVDHNNIIPPAFQSFTFNINII